MRCGEAKKGKRDKIKGKLLEMVARESRLLCVTSLEGAHWSFALLLLSLRGRPAERLRWATGLRHPKHWCVSFPYFFPLDPMTSSCSACPNGVGGCFGSITSTFYAKRPDLMLNLLMLVGMIILPFFTQEGDYPFSEIRTKCFHYQFYRH